MKLLSLGFLSFLSLVSGCSLDAKGLSSASDGGLQAKDGATSDAPVSPDGGLLTNWCSTTGAGHDFCADFDSSLKGTEPGAWCSNLSMADCRGVEIGGMLTLDPGVSTSTPSSASAKTIVGGATSQAFLSRDFPGDLHPLKLAFDVRIDTVGTARTLIASIVLEDTGGNPHHVSLFATPAASDAGTTDATLSVVELPLAGAARIAKLSLTLPQKKFAHVEIRVGIAPNNVTVLVDGVASSTVTIDAPGSAMGRAVQLGLESTPADAWQTHVDDVIFDFTK